MFFVENGGDFDFIIFGMMDLLFDDVVFVISNVGEIFEVIEIEFGYYIIKFIDMKLVEVILLVEVCDEIEV